MRSEWLTTIHKHWWNLYLFLHENRQDTVIVTYQEIELTIGTKCTISASFLCSLTILVPVKCFQICNPSDWHKIVKSF